MLDLKLAFDKKGALGLVSKLERTIQTNRAEALAEINQTILRRIRRRFTTKVDGDGKAWRPWSKQTRRERLKRGTAALGILLETGRLRGGWRYTWTSLAPAFTTTPPTPTSTNKAWSESLAVVSWERMVAYRQVTLRLLCKSLNPTLPKQSFYKEINVFRSNEQHYKHP